MLSSVSRHTHLLYSWHVVGNVDVHVVCKVGIDIEYLYSDVDDVCSDVDIDIGIDVVSLM